MATQSTRTAARIQRSDDTAARLTRGLLACGMIGPVLFVIGFLVEGATRPGYSAWRNFVSQLSLGEQGWQQIANFILCGVLIMGFAFGLWRALRTGRGALAAPVALAVVGLALIAAAIFSTDPQLGYPAGAVATTWHSSVHATTHGIVSLFAFGALAAACFILARRFAGDPAWRGWSVYSVLTGIVVVVFFIAGIVSGVFDTRGIVPDAPTGILQRVAIITGWTWIVLLATRLLARQRIETEGQAH